MEDFNGVSLIEDIPFRVVLAHAQRALDFNPIGPAGIQFP